MTNPHCPLCRTESNVRKLSGGLFFCTRCRNQFDSTPDEGGDYFGDPARRMERQEEDQRNGRVKRPIQRTTRKLKGGLGS